MCAPPLAHCWDDITQWPGRPKCGGLAQSLSSGSLRPPQDTCQAAHPVQCCPAGTSATAPVAINVGYGSIPGHHCRLPDACLLMLQSRLGLWSGGGLPAFARRMFLSLGGTSRGIVKVGAVRGDESQAGSVRVGSSARPRHRVSLERILCCQWQHECVGRWTPTQYQYFGPSTPVSRQIAGRSRIVVGALAASGLGHPEAWIGAFRGVSHEGRPCASNALLHVCLDALGSLECNLLPQGRAPSRSTASLAQGFFNRFYWFRVRVLSARRHPLGPALVG